MRSRPLLRSFLKMMLGPALAAPLLLAACGGESPPSGTGTGGSGNGSGSGGGGGSGGGNGSGGGGGNEGGEVSVDRWGARVWGPILSISRTGRTLWVGTRGMADPMSPEPRIRGGLVRLDIDTGAVRVFESELPLAPYPLDEIEGPTPTGSVIKDGERYLAVAMTGVLAIEGDTVTPHPMESAPVAIAIDRQGGRKRLWVSTSAGLVRMNADTFAVEKVYTEVELGASDTGPLALDPATGAAYVAVYSSDGQSHVARVLDDAVSLYEPGEQGTSLGAVADIVWSESNSAALIALAAWDPAEGGVVAWDGTAAELLVTEGDIAAAAIGEVKPFGASRLALDETEGTLVIGGRLRSVFQKGIQGGGLAWMRLADKKLVGVPKAATTLPGQDIAALSYDPVTRRTYAAVRRPCSDIKLGNLGLLAVSFRGDGSARLERPILSGVRAMALAGDKVLLGLRDEKVGAACDGYAVQTGLVELKANRSGEIVPLTASVGNEDIWPFAGPTALAVRGGEATKLAIGTTGDGTFIGDPAGGYAFNQASTVEVSLIEHDVAWSGDNSVWIAGAATHHTGDDDFLADRGPRGAAEVYLSGSGVIGASRHYVRATDETTDVPGLPSGEVASLVVARNGDAYLACATERVDGDVLDRVLGKPFVFKGEVRTGGIARITHGGKVEVLASGDVAPDPRAVALDEAGTLFALDAQKGLLRHGEGGFEAVSVDPAAPVGSYPRGLWLGKGKDRAALYDTGASVSLGGGKAFVDGVGHAWRATERAAGVLLIGTDEGLVRVRTVDTADIMEQPAGEGAPPPFAK